MTLGRIHIVAPSGPVPMERFERGLKVLRRALRADFVIAANVQEQQGYFAGSDSVRLAALHTAIADPDADAIICARGGYGATRLLGALDPERFGERRKPIVGFSDVTALLCWARMRAGVASIHGPVVTQIGTLPPDDIDRLVDLLEGRVPAPLQAEEGTVIGGGTVDGTLIAGNLEVLRSLVGTRYMPSLQRGVRAIEEVGEAPYRIDRALTQLIASGVLRWIRGAVVGTLHGCEAPGGDAPGPTAHEVVVERLGTLGVPVVTGFQFGHGPSRNAALPFGGKVRLHADDCTLEFLEPLPR